MTATACAVRRTVARALFGTATLCAAATPSAAVPGWSTGAPLQVARQEVGVAELGGKVYVVGGLEGFATVSTVEAYDPVADEWSFVAPLPAPRHHVGVAAANGKLYAIGGFASIAFDAVATVYEYDPGTNEWTPKAPVPTARGALGVAALGGLIYAAGGSPDARERDFAVYDPARDAWTPLPPMPTPRNHLAAGGASGRFYAVGGRTGIAGITNTTTALEEFDPVAVEWTPRAAMPTSRGGVAAAVVNGCLLVFGGEGNAASPVGTFPETEAFDPSLNEWRSLPPMPVPRHGIGAGVVGLRTSIPGGGEQQGFSITDVHEIFESDLSCGPPDVDGDGVTDLLDLCPGVFDPAQDDRGGVGTTSGPDGVGDACQCGDVNGSGNVTLADAVAIQRSLLNPPTAVLARPALCDVAGSVGCSVADAVRVRRALLIPPTATLPGACPHRRKD